MLKPRLVPGRGAEINKLSARVTNAAPARISKAKARTPVGASTINAEMVPNTGGGNPILNMAFGSPAYGTLLQGILLDQSPQGLINFCRDCYYTDAIAGATVDLSSSFPFSDYSLTGLETAELDKYLESMSRLNMRSLMGEISSTHLVDGAFIGTLVFDPMARSFQDILVHDSQNTQVTLQPMHSQDPVIKANTSASLGQFLDSGSPYVESMIASYPPNLIELYRSGSVFLDPLTTLFVPRRGMQDVSFSSYLRRLIPVYLFEKVMYRGTLMEAYKRQRSTTHIKVGTENWIPSDEEMASILADAQMTELDPLGGWLVTREGVEFNEFREPSASWRWTDIIEQLTPIKLRALGVSEAFLSGDASYGTAESAITSFTDSMNSFRQFITYRVFTSKLFPLIAVLHNLYKDPDLVKRTHGTTSGAMRSIYYSLTNLANLKMPTIQWHKSLEGKDVDSQMELLEKLSEKGFVIPLRMWASSAGLDLSALMRDLEEDRLIKQRMEELTGKKSQTIGNEDHKGFDEETFLPEDSGGDVQASVMEGLIHGVNKGTGRRVPLLARDMTGLNIPRNGKMSRSGDVMHATYGDHRQDRMANDRIYAALKKLNSSPEYYESVRRRVNTVTGGKNTLGLTS